jgi:cytochrome c553
MKKLLISIAALGLVAWQGMAWAGDAAEMAEVCLDCHEFSEFEGMDAAALMTATKEANAAEKEMADAVSDLSDEDLKAVVDYVAAQAGK